MPTRWRCRMRHQDQETIEVAVATRADCTAPSWHRRWRNRTPCRPASQQTSTAQEAQNRCCTPALFFLQITSAPRHEWGPSTGFPGKERRADFRAHTGATAKGTRSPEKVLHTFPVLLADHEQACERMETVHRFSRSDGPGRLPRTERSQSESTCSPKKVLRTFPVLHADHEHAWARMGTVHRFSRSDGPGRLPRTNEQQSPVHQRHADHTHHGPNRG